MNFEKELFYFFQLIQKLVEKYQRYPSDIERELESENKIDDLDIDSLKQLPIKSDHQKRLKNNKKKSLEKQNYEFPNESNFDDAG